MKEALTISWAGIPPEKQCGLSLCLSSHPEHESNVTGHLMFTAAMSSQCDEWDHLKLQIDISPFLFNLLTVRYFGNRNDKSC